LLASAPGLEPVQRHNVHDVGDADWVKCFGRSGGSYRLFIENVGVNGNPVVDLYIGATATHLVYQPNLHFTAKQIVGSNYVPFEESNTINIVPEMNLTLYEDPRLTSTTMWFMLAKNDKFDINVFTAQEPDLVIGDAPDTTRDRIATSDQWFTFGWGDARMFYLGRT